jgi:hypothetical protein
MENLIVAAEVQQNGLALEHAMAEINETIGPAEVQLHGLALEHATTEINEIIVTAEVQQNGLALQHATTEMNEIIVAAEVHQHGLALEHATEQMNEAVRLPHTSLLNALDASRFLQCSKASYLAWYEKLEELAQNSEVEKLSA